MRYPVHRHLLPAHVYQENVIVQIILIQIYGLLCQHSLFTGFLQAAVILIQPNHALKLSGFECFQTAVINVSHVCIQYGIVFLVCDSISQIIGSVALCRLCCQEVISIVRCSQIIRFCDPVAVCFRVICCLTIKIRQLWKSNNSINRKNFGKYLHFK